MKKVTSCKLFIIFGVILFSLVLSSCSRHEHIFNYSYDDNYHWKECECGEHLDKELHNYEVLNDNNLTHEKCVICGKENQIENLANYKQITDTKLIDGLMNIRLDYELYSPDRQLSYKYIWDGYDLENKFGPSMPEEERFYTYLTEYKETNNTFYLIYLNKDVISSYKELLRTYEQEIGNPQNYHFSSYDNEQIIDGKYFYCFQTKYNEMRDKIKFFETESLENIKFSIDNYQLVLCARSKQAIIKENLSTSKKLNKEISVYNRYEIEFKDINSYPTYYEFDLPEKSNQVILNNMFEYVGEMIEAFPNTYENIDYTCFPTLGLGEYFWCLNVRVEVVVIDNEKYMCLPRYVLSGNERLDLLSHETNLFFEEDVFREYKSIFSEALVCETDIIESFYIMALYDYDKVVNIIKIK